MKKSGVVKLKIKDIMSTPAITVNGLMKIREVIRLFVDRKISGAPLVNPQTGALVSVVSEADLMKFGAMSSLDEPLLLLSAKLPEAKDLVVVEPEDSFADVFKKLITNPVRRVIVVDSMIRPIGVVSRRDIIRAFIEHEMD